MKRDVWREAPAEYLSLPSPLPFAGLLQRLLNEPALAHSPRLFVKKGKRKFWMRQGGSTWKGTSLSGETREKARAKRRNASGQPRRRTMFPICLNLHEKKTRRSAQRRPPVLAVGWWIDQQTSWIGARLNPPEVLCVRPLWLFHTNCGPPWGGGQRHNSVKLSSSLTTGGAEAQSSTQFAQNDESCNKCHDTKWVRFILITTSLTLTNMNNMQQV